MGLKGDEEQKLAWLSQIWRGRLEVTMRLECWSDVEEEESCLFILSIRISLTHLSNRIAKEINSFNVLVSSHTASLSLMELEISLNNSKAVSPNLWHIGKEELYTSVEQDSHSYSAFH